jgi:hypothetical protein
VKGKDTKLFLVKARQEINPLDKKLGTIYTELREVLQKAVKRKGPGLEKVSVL